MISAWSRRCATRSPSCMPGASSSRRRCAELFKAPRHPYTAGLLARVAAPHGARHAPDHHPRHGAATRPARHRLQLRRPLRARDGALPERAAAAVRLERAPGGLLESGAMNDVPPAGAPSRLVERIPALLLDLEDVAKHFPRQGRQRLVRAVDGVVLTLARRDARHRRRVRLRQVHAGAAAAAADRADARTRYVRGRGPAGARRRATCAPVRRDMQIVFQDPYASLDPALTVGAHHRRAAGRSTASASAPNGGAGSPSCSRSSASRPTRPAAIRTNSPAASASASASRGRSRWSRSWWCSTSRCRRSTSRSSRRSSTC